MTGAGQGPRSAALAQLPEGVRARLDGLRDALTKAAGDAVSGVIVFGSAARGGWREGRSDIDVMVVLRDDARPVLDRLGNALLRARYQDRVEAILLRADELAHSADVFPLLYDEVREDGVAILGDNPFAALHISDKHRRLRIEQELREARIRMRRMVTDGNGAPVALAQTVERKLRQIRSPLRALLKLRGEDPGSGLDAVLDAACKAWSLERAPLGRAQEDAAAAYDALAKLLAAAIDDVDRRDADGGAG